MTVRLLVLLFTLCLAVPAAAHKPSDSYLTLDATGPTLSVRWDIALKDLEFAVGLDADRDSRITWGEVKAQQDAIAAYALSRLDLRVGDTPVVLRIDALQIDDHSDGTYGVLVLVSDTPADADGLSLSYRLLFDIDPTHRGLVRFRDGAGGERSVVLSPESSTVELKPGGGGRWRALADYAREGVRHIWIGFDHILFLIALLLPAVLIRRDRGWEAVDGFRPALRSVLTIVTMFTVAHSVTLWLATMEWVVLPIRPVEAVIALSIVVTAVHNLWPRLPLPGPAVAFGFGLIHGFGFASVLGDLGLNAATFGVALLGFNLGVELGQLAIVAVFFPVAYRLRGTGFYRWGVLRGGSAAIALLALVWFVERAFNLEIVGF